MVSDVLLDIRLAIRLLAKDRRFTLAALAALALGIAANTTVFTFVNTALFKPLPFDRPEQLISLGTRDERGRTQGMSYLDVQDWRRSARAFSSIAAHTGATMNLSEADRAPGRFRGAYVSANTFDLLRVRPILGRGFLETDDRPRAPPVVVIGYDVWTDRYGSDRSTIGRTVKVNDVPATIVGVMPPRFRYPGTMEMWQPLSTMSGLTAARRDARTLNAIARLADEASVDRARTELASIAADLARAYPDTNRGIVPTIARPLENLRQGTKPSGSLLRSRWSWRRSGSTRSRRKASRNARRRSGSAWRSARGPARSSRCSCVGRSCSSRSA